MKKYKSEAAKALHEVADAMHKAGIIPDERMREFDRSHLVDAMPPVTPAVLQKLTVPVRSPA